MKRCAGVVMMMMMVMAVAAGCGGSSSKKDGSADGPGGGDVPTGATRGSQCMQVMTTFCDRAGSSTCALFPADQIPDCVSSGVTACCAGDCNAGVVGTQAEIDTCIGDLNAATCASLDVTNGGALPASCVGVVRSALTTGSSALVSGAASLPQRAGRIVSN